MTVGSDNEVIQTKVTVGQSVSGWAIIQGGLKDDDQVIINGIQRARAGLKVEPTAETLTVDAEALLRGRGQPDTAPVGSDTAPTEGAATAPAAGEASKPTAPASETAPSPTTSAP